MKNIYFFMCMSLSGLILHACDDGDRKSAVAREDAEQKKIRAAFAILFEHRSEASKTAGAGLPKALAEKTVGMLEEWEPQSSFRRYDTGHAKFFTKAGMICSRVPKLLEFVDCTGKAVEHLNFAETYAAPQFSVCENAAVPLLAVWQDKLDIINIDTFATQRSIYPLESWRAVEFTKDGKRLMTASCSGRIASLCLHDIETAGRRADFLEDGLVKSARLSPDGNSIALGTHDALRKDEHLVRIFDVRSRKFSARELVCQSDISDMRFINGGKELVVAENFDKGTISTWDLGTVRKKQTIEQEAEHIAIDAAGRRLVSCGFIVRKPQNCVLLWDLTTGKKIVSFNTGKNSGFKACDISADGNAILAVTDGPGSSSLKVWTKVPLKQQLGEIQARRIVQARRNAKDDGKAH